MFLFFNYDKFIFYLLNLLLIHIYVLQLTVCYTLAQDSQQVCQAVDNSHVGTVVRIKVLGIKKKTNRYESWEQTEQNYF